MLKGSTWGVLIAWLALLSGFLNGCSEEKETEPSLELTFVGSATCSQCHADVMDQLLASGHAHKLTPVRNGRRPDDPRLHLPDNPPEGYTWDQIAYVLGGFAWKARFIIRTGDHLEVITGEAAQWNIATGEWVPYDPGETKPYDYSCFRCHTTGPDEMADAWFEENVMCEACHGRGSLHAADAAAHSDDPDLDLIDVDPSAELCGRCHNRGGLDAPAPASGGFIRHHEQYNEMQSARHRFIECGDCHDPHVGVRGDQTGGIVQDCSACHDPEAHADRIHANFGPDCVWCHLPKATKSAAAVNIYQGDVKTHVFKIHAGPEGKDSMFDENGALKRDYGVTLDFVCYQCHTDPDGVGGEPTPVSQKTLEELAAAADTIHAHEKLVALRP